MQRLSIRRVLPTALGLGALLSIGAVPALSALPTLSTAGAGAGVSAYQVCPAPTPGTSECDALVRAAAAVAAVAPGTNPPGYSPTQLRKAYSLPATTTGHPLVAIADAYGDSHGFSDLTAYRAQYGLPKMSDCKSHLTAKVCFQRVTQTGATSGYPANNKGWDEEQSLDVDMVSAVCPQCSILLVESNTPSDTDLGTAVNEAVALGAVVVSNSYSGSEDTAVESDYSHAGVAIVASTGDSGHQSSPATPAGYPSVIAAGGTSLTSISPRVESAWSGSGSYCTTYAQPSWQSGVVAGCAKRAAADVSSDADPNTGVAVYDKGWWVFGGTSASSPFISGAIAATGNASAFGTNGASYMYAHASSLNDVTSGSNGTCSGPMCHARAGWDGPTGLGSPDGQGAL